MQGFFICVPIVRVAEHMSSSLGHLSLTARSLKFKVSERGMVMKDLIARQLYQPAVVLPLLLLTRLMVSHDFNLTQVMFVMMLKGSQQAFHFVRGAMPRSRGGDVHHIACRNCC
jgi:type IV secretory pathway VirB3-like protein